MTKHLVLTTAIERSMLGSGQEVFTASFVEMPGVVAEGATELAAEAELLSCLQHLKENLGLEAIGVRTRFVQDWVWESYSTDDKLVMEFGTGRAVSAEQSYEATFLAA